MRTEHLALPLQHLIIVDASGTLDLPASKAALDKLAADPEFDSRTEVLLDLRDVDCKLSTLDIYELASYMAWPNPALPTRKKIAILVEGRTEFDHALFLQMCTTTRGLHIEAFDDYQQASQWLNASVPQDPKNGAGHNGSTH
jgi:hypothetical protein